MVDSDPTCWCVAPGSCLLGSTNSHSHRRRRGEHKRVEDPVLSNGRGSQFALHLAQSVASCATTCTGSVGVESIPRHHTFLRDGSNAVLVSIDQEGQHNAPAVVWHTTSIVERRQTPREGLVGLFVEGSNVVGHSVVVPADDLDELGHESKYLLPAIVPQIISTPEPILTSKAWHVCEEPWRDGHHIWLAAEEVEV